MPDPTHPLVTATSLAVGTTGTHTLNAATTNDYYRFTLSGRSSVNLALTGLDSNVDLQLLGSSGVVLQQSTNTGTTADDVNFTDLSAGVYYIRVLPANGTTSAHYTLSLQAQQNAQTDLLWRNYSTGQNALWQMQGTTLASSVSLTAVADSHWQLAGSADFTGDGQADLVWRNQATGQNAVWQMNGTTLVSSLPLPAVTDLNWQIVSVADWNGDGQADLLWRNQATGANQVWLMQGLATVTTLSLPAVTDRNWQLAGSGDWNRDGQADLVWRNQATGQNAVWLMQGTTYVTNAFLTPLNDSNWRIAGVSDWNGDNQPDLVWRNQSTGQDAIWYLQGTTLGGGVFFTQVADLNWQIAAPWVVYGDPGVADTAGNTTTTAFNIGSLTGQATYTGVVNSSDTNDYYRFTLPTAAPTVTLQLNGLSGDADLQLLDASGNTLQTASNSGTTAERLQRSLAAGTYYLRVYPGVTGASANYTLSFDANPTTLADSFTLQEGNNFLTQISKSIALGPTQGTRKLSFDVSAQFGTIPSAGGLEDAFLVYLVDTTNHTLLDQGQGTAVFSLAGSKAEFTPGLVTYNGTTVTLDLSSLKDQTSGTLIFQLLNNDTDTTAAVQVQHLTSTVDPTGVSSPTLAAATTVLPGAAIGNVSSFTATTALKPLLSNLHRNPTTGKFVANLQVQNTDTTAVGRQLIALFANLPAGVTLVNASGTNANGKPYLNLKPAIANGGLAAGALSDAVEITFDDPNLVSFNWQPTFLSGPANQAPVLNAIAPITLTPGAYRTIFRRNRPRW